MKTGNIIVYPKVVLYLKYLAPKWLIHLLLAITVLDVKQTLRIIDRNNFQYLILKIRDLSETRR